MKRKISQLLTIIVLVLTISDNIQAQNDSIKSITLDEVLVTSKNTYRDGDHFTIIPTNTQKDHSPTGFALLSNLMIPGLTFDDNGVVTTMGFHTGLYINGQPASVQDVVYLQPMEVSKVEIYDAPTGKFAKDNMAINFVIKQYSYGGYASVAAEQSFGLNKGDYRVSTSINKGKMTYSLFGGYQYANIDNISIHSTDNYIFTNNTIQRNAISQQRPSNRNGYAQFQARYQTNNKYLVGKLSFIEQYMPTTTSSGNVFYNDETSLYSSTSSNKSISPKLDLNGEIMIGKTKSITFGLHGKYARNKYTRIYEEAPYEYITNGTEDVGNFNAGLIYTQKLSKGTFTAEIFNYYDLFKTQYSGNYAENERLWKNEALVFGSYNYPFNNYISLQTRLGIDWYQYKLENHTKFNSWNPRLNLKLTNQLKKGMLLWSFMLANSNYNMDVINDATIQLNPYLVRKGNPDLRKSYDIDTYLYYSLPVRKINLTALLQYQFYKNPVTYSYSQTEHFILQSFDNHGQDHVLSTAIGITYSPIPTLAVTGDIRYSYTSIDLSNKYHHNNINGNFGLQWRIKHFMITPRLNFSTSTIDRYSLSVIHIPFNYSLKVSYSYKNLIASATAYAPFGKREFKQTLVTPVYNYNSTILNRQNYQYYTISLSYLLNFGRKVRQIEPDIDSSIDSSILRERQPI